MTLYAISPDFALTHMRVSWLVLRLKGFDTSTRSRDALQHMFLFLDIESFWCAANVSRLWHRAASLSPQLAVRMKQ
jgi:hypothetical protein